MKVTLDSRDVFFGGGSGHPPPDAPAVLFVHGAGFDHSVWVMPARYFARHGLRVVAPDLPGHGRSAGPALRRIEDMADWLDRLLDQIGVARATVVGHSMGSLVSLAMASRHPQRVERLALLGASAPMPVGAPLLDAAADNHPAAFSMANTWSHSTRGRIGASQNPGLSNLVSGQRWLERMREDVYFADLAACNAFTSLPEVGSVPALVIAGDEDRMTPASAGLQLAGSLDAARTVVLRGCGHAMLAEQPNQVLDALADFIRVEPSGSAE